MVEHGFSHTPTLTTNFTRIRVSLSVVLMPYICPPRKNKNRLKLSVETNYGCRNTQSNLLSADTTFSSGLRRIRSSQVSLSSLLDAQPTPSLSPAQPTHAVPVAAQHNMLTSKDDLTKFPSESLHSFSFSQPRDPTAILESRQNVLRKSIDYMKDKLHGGAPTTPWAEQTLSSTFDSNTRSKDEDVLQSLKRANLIPDYWDETNLPPPTAPAVIVEDPFDILDSEPLTMLHRKKRTSTDLSGYKMQAKLLDAVTKPYSLNTPAQVPMTPSFSPVGDRRMSLQVLPTQPSGAIPGVVPVHTTNRLAPTMQAIFSTEATAPWKILNTNDLACLEFGVTEQEIKRGVSILECFEHGRREWVEERLKGSTSSDDAKSSQSSESTKQENIADDTERTKDESKERVVLCGEVISMRKMTEGGTAKKSPLAASLWVKEKVYQLSTWANG
jgi:protein-serine/threonine kinase